MDGVGILVGVLVGGGLVGAVAFLQLRTAKERETANALALTTAQSELNAARIDLAAANERSSRAEQLEAQLATREQAIEAFRSELEELRIREKGHEAELLSAQQRFEDREKDLQARVQEKIEFLENKEQQLKESFDALAGEALRKSRQDFLSLAEERLKAQSDASKAELDAKQKAIDTLVRPIAESLKEYQENLNKIEVARAEQTTKLSEQIEAVNSLQKAQTAAAADLRGLLRGPQSRGRIGELFLKRLLDSAGLQETIHYRMQVSSTAEDSRSRPDCIIFLPSGKCLVIDAKTPLNAYEDAYNTDDEAFRTAKLKEHVRNVRGEIDRLSRRDYEQVEQDVEHVIMYLPIEASLSAAYEVDPEVHTYGWNKNVVLASPTLLYLFLHMVKHDWRQHEVAKNAREIEKLGGEMVDRIRVVAEHVSKVGTSLDAAARNYNKAVSSIDSQLFTSATRFAKLGAKSKKEPEPLSPVSTTATTFDKPALKSLPSAERLAELETISLFEDPDDDSETD